MKKEFLLSRKLEAALLVLKPPPPPPLSCDCCDSRESSNYYYNYKRDSSNCRDSCDSSDTSACSFSSDRRGDISVSFYGIDSN